MTSEHEPPPTLADLAAQLAALAETVAEQARLLADSEARIERLEHALAVLLARS